MTDLLRKAFDQASKLDAREQDDLARWLLAELQSEQQWQRHFSDSQDDLSKLAREALDEHERGETKPLDLDAM